MLPETDRAKVRIGIRWHTGATDEITTDRPRPPIGPTVATPTAAVELIRALGPTTSNADLVTTLNQAGHRTGRGRPFDIDAVQWVRHVHHIPTPGRSPPARSASPRPPPGSASPPTPSTTGSRPGTCPPASAAPATGWLSPGHRRSRPPAAPVSPAQAISTPKSQPIPAGGQYETAVPTVADRVVQAALKLVLEPIFEQDFRTCSYGFRRTGARTTRSRRSTTSAAEAIPGCWKGHRGMFDTIDHTALLGRVRRRVGDKRSGAGEGILQVRILTELGEQQETRTGTPQGGILSPLLSNIALSVLDDYYVEVWNSTMKDGNARYRRRQKGCRTGGSSAMRMIGSSWSLDPELTPTTCDW